MTSSPSVSVIVPTYRRAGSIRRAVESALAQTVTDLEVVVVDDGSRDGTDEVVHGLGDERIRLFTHETNRGGNAARQTGMDQARGTWLAFLDSDDLWLPEKLEKQLQRLDEQGPEYGFCYTWYDIELNDGSFLPPRQVRAEGLHRPELIAEPLVGTFSTMMVSRAVAEQVGGVDLSLPACQDWEFVSRVSQVTGVCVVPEVLVHYWHGAGDPHRITTRKDSVVAGHRQIYRQLCREYPSMPDENVRASRHYLMKIFADQGAFAELFEVTRGLGVSGLDPAMAAHAGRMFLRAGRRRVSALRG
ncbi:Glycosyl transferase family 2 [Austwickia chelonae]|uniref:Putative glycosyltransferase n=1 Tax=Austwickia chelonae NBRC 105200 TaxID=1184607 RepID=K6V3N0_9MICO|nr:glycosyltransferase family 2 protein [Austwickia chelonae]GAB76693.1 putative glycosyltransferase [Austwickia chelonae NBRC 105200]SEW29366.1 Glycosyl transferase family 2 [Austwickia chelonae]